jgi:hypothetical protein
VVDLGVIYCAAVPILLISAGMFLSNILFTLRAKKTSGTVVGYRTSRSARGGGGEAEIVEFTGPDGNTIQFTEKVYRARIIQREGHTVNVLYDPNNPSRARINSFATLYLIPVILAVVGIGMILFNFPMFQGPIQKLLDFLDALVKKLPWWL